MFPDGQIIITIDTATRKLIAPFLPPKDQIRAVETEIIIRGGIAIQDGSEGFDYQNWFGHWDESDETVYLKSETGAPVALFTLPDIVELSVTFDQNMMWNAVARDKNQVAHHYWYSTLAEDYVSTQYPAISSAALCLDETRRGFGLLADSDVILLMLKTDGTIEWRLQRDRYDTPYTIPGSWPHLSRIAQFGMSKTRRMQWQLKTRKGT